MNNLQELLLENVATAPDEAAAARFAPDTALRLAIVGLQLLALLAVVRVFQLENRTVFYVLAGAGAGWVVHALLPAQYRLTFFGLLSLASVVAVLGWPAAPIVLALGFALIAICHVPVPFWLRGLALLVAGVTLLILRQASDWGSVLFTVAPVLGAMFMFRLVLYLQAVRRGTVPVGPIRATAYLFMLPNVCYPLFPVVDYDRFISTDFASDRFRTYDRGLRFMLRGVVHLLVYRVVYYDLALDSLYLNSLADVARYVIANFLIYVQVSGQFHLVVGLLCLYGFRLPETNHLYFLASSPTDFWRRINIYWKDFMTRLVYYPSYFKLRKHGRIAAVGLATANVFLATWLLHAYQFYWLRGGRLFARRDVAFWGAFGALTLAAAVWEARPGRPQLQRTDRSWSLRRGLSTVITFLAIATLWSLWNAASLRTWLFMWTQTRYSTPGTWLVLLVLATAFTVLAGFGWGAASLDAPTGGAESLRMAARTALRRTAVMALLVMAGSAGLEAQLPRRSRSFAQHLHGQGWSHAEVAGRQVGYYEQLTERSTRLAVPWHPPRHWEDMSVFLEDRPDFLLNKIIPSTTTTFYGATLTTNALGMRDRPRTVAKPPDTHRIAVLGPSDVMGWGVNDEDVFTRVLESRLDAAASASAHHVEVLNFGVPAYNLAQEVVKLDSQALRFAPDVIVLAVHPYDLAAMEEAVSKAATKGYSIPDSALKDLASQAGALPNEGGNVANLRVVEEAIDRALLRRARAAAARVHASLVVLLMRSPNLSPGGNLPTARRAIAAVGIRSVDCTQIWPAGAIEAYQLSSYDDTHPSADGHRLLASCLYDSLTREGLALPEAVRLSTAGPTAAH